MVDCSGLVYVVSVPRLLRYLQSCGNERDFRIPGARQALSAVQDGPSQL